MSANLTLTALDSCSVTCVFGMILEWPFAFHLAGQSPTWGILDCCLLMLAVVDSKLADRHFRGPVGGTLHSEKGSVVRQAFCGLAHFIYFLNKDHVSSVGRWLHQSSTFRLGPSHIAWALLRSHLFMLTAQTHRTLSKQTPLFKDQRRQSAKLLKLFTPNHQRLALPVWHILIYFNSVSKIYSKNQIQIAYAVTYM